MIGALKKPRPTDQMTATERHEAMVRACIAAYETVQESGTREMQLAARILLKLIGDQLAQQAMPPVSDADTENGGET
ncbi:hypothetical protein MKK69_30135 [Methylobacterium sp. J-026]|uniref:hypothetical protein n=1 Tax=Methylobacterium sp. J-026 TaxID=2836624 RepID=UPI001FB8970E|nr:hypothetical protein [Methylobacterium sp. J-026]MCJ2138263.1 hypothetical protein [Methylobacterium sp. J-026]